MDETWAEYLREVFLTPGFIPSDAHKAILQLDSRIIFTLNFDDIYERTANEAQPGSHIVKSYHDSDIPEFLRKDGRFIVKVHGSLNTPTKMIFTQEEYARSRTKNAAFYSCFEASLLTHSFFFVGVGYNDPDLSLLLENQSFLFDGGQPHYYLTSSDINADLIKSLRKNRNLKTIKYDKIDSQYSGLPACLSDLLELVENARRKLLETTNW
ncbi:Sir2-like protein [Hyphomonas oceanitis SCH89]|uniref:Sir2-like protein n=2 Tax=Hyphomonas oceanitis TaxID=81033 RepID=A0A059G8N6_9PROT|nr:Sir2-like protein [Hyphomonas oceanitis SCH89]